jgi:putative autotransporter adhesin-like protein
MRTNEFGKLFDVTLTLFSIAFLLGSLGNVLAQTKTIPTASFNKVIVSPHIAVTFIEGDMESVTIESNSEPMQKMNVEVEGKTLRLYLDGAKTVTKSERMENDKQKGKQSIYKGTIVTAIVTYKNLQELSLRGEETFTCESPLIQEKFRLRIYGESHVILNEVNFNNMQVTIYGESVLELKNGSIGRQKITAYGETKVNTLGVKGTSAKITAYGEGSYRVKVSDHLKVTAYGEATVAYEGNPDVDRGIIIGEATIQRIN